jgi:hypothetical protein
MQLFRLPELREEGPLGRLNVLLVTRDTALGNTPRRLAAAGAELRMVDELYDALAMLSDDPRDSDLLVVDCEGFGGLERVRAMIGMLPPQQVPLRIVLTAKECADQRFDWGQGRPVVLRAPVTGLALRLALDSLFRLRFLPSSEG